MNYFVTLHKLKTYNELSYYTVNLRPLEGDEDYKFDPSHLEFNKFAAKFSNDPKYSFQFNNMLALIKRLGNNARLTKWLKHEGPANAFPPVFPQSMASSIDESADNIELRLYCVVLNTVIILLNGDIKTARTAQECDNVMPHFRNAVTLAKQIQRSIVDKEIEISNKNIKIADSAGFFM